MRTMNIQTPILKQIEAERKKERRFHIIMSAIVLALVIGLVAVVWFAVKVSQKNHARFMAGCMEDHKEYECTYMWRASERDTPPPQIIYVPPTGR